MRKILVAVLAGLLLVPMAAVADNIIYPIGMASTQGFSNGTFAGPSARGWDFVIDQPITVVQLGINAGVSIPITMSLWDVTSQTLLGQTTVNSSPFAWEFANLGTPINLTPGHTFSVIGWADTTGQSGWYIYNNTPPPEFNPTGTVTYQDVRYGNNLGANDFPTGVIGAPAQYGVADIGYTTVPEPMTLALMGTGLGLVGVVRRKLNL